MQIPTYLRLPSYFSADRVQVSGKQNLLPQKPDQVHFSAEYRPKPKPKSPNGNEAGLLLMSADEGRAVCNPAAWRMTNGDIGVLYRRDDEVTFLSGVRESPFGAPIFPPNHQGKRLPSRDCVADHGVGPFLFRRHFAWLGAAVLSPDARTMIRNGDGPVMPLRDIPRFPNGFEDPRVTKIGDTYYIVVAAINAVETKTTKEPVRLNMKADIKGHYIYLITTQDFENFDYVGQIGPDIFDKNAFFHSEPVNVNGKPHFLLFHRLKGDIQAALSPSIQTFKDSDFWSNEVRKRRQRTILKPLFNWEGISSVQYPDWPGQIAGAAAPISFYYNEKTKRIVPPESKSKIPPEDLRKGWLFLYNGAGPPDARKKVVDRDIGACVLTIKENVHSVDDLPVSVLARSPVPILSPKTEQEKNAPRGGEVVFSCGYLPIDDGRLAVLYGSGDTAISITTFNFPELCNYLLQFSPEGDRLEL